MTSIAIPTSAGLATTGFPESGVSDYYASLNTIAGNFCSSVEATALTESAVPIGDPQSGGCVFIDTGGVWSVSISPALQAQYGYVGCIPLLMWSYADATDDSLAASSPQAALWHAVGSYDAADGDGVSLKFYRGGTKPDDVVDIINNVGSPILVTGYLWFPARADSCAAGMVSP